MTSQTEQPLCMVCEEERETDEFGFPIDWVHKPVTKRCGHCRQKGHNKRTCPAFAATQKQCLVYPQESLASSSSQEGSPNEGCMCLHCAEYRRLNLPTPEKAAQLIKRQEAEKKKEYPITDIINKTADQVYIWLLDKSDGKLKLLGAVRSGDRYVIRLEEPIMKNHVRNLIVTDRIYVDFEKATNYGIHLEDLMDEDILQKITVEHGKSFEYDIHENALYQGLAHWRISSLKSKYLLEQLIRLGAMDNPNFEPILDMLQDIDFPIHNEYDKDEAGVPSELTNTVETTDIDEPEVDREVIDSALGIGNSEHYINSTNIINETRVPYDLIIDGVPVEVKFEE